MSKTNKPTLPSGYLSPEERQKIATFLHRVADQFETGERTLIITELEEVTIPQSQLNRAADVERPILHSVNVTLRFPLIQ